MENNSVVELLQLFPDYDIEIIQIVLIECNGDTQKATQVLLSMQEMVPTAPPLYEDIPEELLKKIKEDEAQEKKRRLKECMQYDKEVEKVLSASLKEYEKEQKKLNKTKKTESTEMSEKEGKKPNNLNQVDKNEIALKSSHEIIASQNKVYDAEKQPADNMYPSLPEIKPPIENPQPKKSKLGFSDKLKNIFKSKPKQPEENEKFDIEIPDISKTNMIPRSDYDEFNANNIN